MRMLLLPMVGLLIQSLGFAATSITFSTPGSGVFRWGAGSDSADADASRWAASGGLRIGDNTVSTVRPVYRFRLPRAAGLTLNRLQFALQCEEHNTLWGDDGTDVYFNGAKIGSIGMGVHDGGQSGSADRTFTISGASTIDRAIKGKSDGDTLTDYLEIELVNSGFDDLDIGSVSLSCTYASADPALLGTYHQITTAYYHLKAYQEHYVPILEAMDRGAAVHEGVELGIQKTLAAGLAIKDIGGISVSGLNIGSLASWFTTLQPIVGTLRGFADNLRAWQEVGDALNDLFGTSLYHLEYLGKKGSKNLRANVPGAVAALKQIAEDTRSALADGAFPAPGSSLEVRLGALADTTLPNLRTACNECASALAGANVNGLIDAGKVRGYLDRLAPLMAYNLNMAGNQSTPRPSDSFLTQLIGFLGAFKTGLSATEPAANFTYSGGKITGYTGPGGRVVIPATLGGRPVTSIGYGAFRNNDTITSITIPGSVTHIGEKAFYHCGALTSVTIPEGVQSIGDSAFAYCDALTSVAIPGSAQTIGFAAFRNCGGLKSVEIGAGVQSIGSRAFQYCGALISITIPDSVQSIGKEAFARCGALASVFFKGDAPSLGSFVFAHSSPTVYHLPGTSGWGSTFGGRPAAPWRGFLFRDASGNGFRYVLDGATIIIIGYTGPGGRVDLPAAIGGVPVTAIGTRAFYANATITSITIPDSVQSIGKEAFQDCTALASVEIGAGVQSIGGRAFWDCGALTSITIPDRVQSIGDSAFQSCGALEAVYFEGDAPTLGSDVFASTTATIYHLPGTSGWGSMFGGRPVATLRAAAPHLLGAGMRAVGRFGFEVQWTAGREVVVEVSDDLAGGVWTPVATNTLPTGNMSFEEAAPENRPTRFYRVRAK